MERGFARVYQRHFVHTLRHQARRKAKEDPGAFDLRAVTRRKPSCERHPAIYSRFEARPADG